MSEAIAMETVLSDILQEAAARLRCSRCGKSVSTPVPTGTLVRAWIECPECLEREPLRAILALARQHATPTSNCGARELAVSILKICGER